MTFTPELGQMDAGATYTSTPTPPYVTDGLGVLDALYGERFEGGEDLHARTSNHGGSPILTDVFEMRAYCWCDGDTPGHEESCPPNFRHTASGFEANWYKHASRGETCSRDITAVEWAQMLAECIQSLTALPGPYRVVVTGSREYGKDLLRPGSKKVFVDDWRTAPSPQRDAMVAALRAASARAAGRPMLIVHGGAAGADTLSGMLAQVSGKDTEVWPALWRREDGTTRGGYDRAEALRMQNVFTRGAGYFRGAGPERNQAMVDAGADECLAFKAIGATNRGTQHCIDAATAAGIPVTITEA